MTDNISYEYMCNNSYQNTTKPNPNIHAAIHTKILPKHIKQYIKIIMHHDQVGFILGIQEYVEFNILKSM